MPSSGTDPGFRRKIAVSMVILGAAAVIAVGLQFVAEGAVRDLPGTGSSPGKTVFSWSDFRYGPQSWRPFYDPIAIGTGERSADEWYVMFTRLNGTPYGGNPLLHRRGDVRVGYRFENLAGAATFSAYGVRQSDGQYMTNRYEGYGNSSFTVIGGPPFDGPDPDLLPLPGSNRVSITTSDLGADAGIGSSNGTYFVRFEKGPASGLDALHFTVNRGIRKGMPVETGNQSGEFYVTSTGGSILSDLVLMVSVNGTQPGSFRLTLDSSFIEEGR